MPPEFDKLTPDELEEIRMLIEENEMRVVSESLRRVVAKHWPWLLPKLPPPPK